MLSTVSYDVDAPEDAPKSRSAYINKKDLRWIIAILIALIALGYPLWVGFVQQRDKQVCATNMHGVWQAMMLYAAENGDRLPPLYEVGPGGAPMLNKAGKPLVWATLLQRYMNPRAQFFCPAADDSEKMPAIGGKAGIDLTYGMYVAMGSQPYPLLAKPDDTALLVETSNHGAMGSYNPLPFKDDKENVVPFDAFMAGYDDSNGPLTPASQWVTRLAVRGVSNGYKTDGATTRHKQGIHVFYVQGNKGLLQAPDAEIRNIYPDAEGPWRIR